MSGENWWGCTGYETWIHELGLKSFVNLGWHHDERWVSPSQKSKSKYLVMNPWKLRNLDPSFLVCWTPPYWTYHIPDTIHQINGAQQYDRAITNDWPNNCTYLLYFLSLFCPLRSSHNQQARWLRATKDRPRSPHWPMAKQTRLHHCFQSEGGSQQQIEMKLFAMCSGLWIVMIWLDAKHAKKLTYILRCIQDRRDILMKWHNRGISGQSLCQGRRSCLEACNNDLLRFIVEHQEQGIAVSVLMVMRRAKQILPQFALKSRVTQYHLALRFVRSQGLFFVSVLLNLNARLQRLRPRH